MRIVDGRGATWADARTQASLRTRTPRGRRGGGGETEEAEKSSWLLLALARRCLARERLGLIQSRQVVAVRGGPALVLRLTRTLRCKCCN